MRGSVAICARDSTWKTPTVSAAAACRRPPGRRAAGAPDRSSTPSCARTSGTASSSTAIMPRPSRSTLMMPEVGAVVLVPLHDDAARHRRRLERHHLVEPARRRSPCRPSAGRGGAADPASAPAAREQLHDAPVVDRQPAARRAARPASSSGRPNSKWPMTLGQPVDLVPVEARAPCPSRAPPCAAAIGDARWRSWPRRARRSARRRTG